MATCCWYCLCKRNVNLTLSSTFKTLFKMFELITNEFFGFLKCFFLHIVEWALTVLLGVVFVVIAFFIEPLHDRAVYDNYEERYPYVGETIGMTELFFLVIILPCIIIGVLSLIFPKKFELCLAYLSLAQALVITLVITEILKVTVSRPRPNYFKYCGYDEKLKKCTGFKYNQKDAKVSFLSGHASSSFASMTWLYLFIDKLGLQGQELWFILIKFLPFVLAIFISATRIIDYMHHVSDVISGTVLGIGIGYIVFKAQKSRMFTNQKHPFESLTQI